MGKKRWFSIALATLSIAALGVSARGEVPLFETPPDPSRLAEILYQPRLRSAEVAPPSGFAMRIHFDLDSSELTAESLPLLDSVADMLALPAARDELLVIEGHTDATGSVRYNQSLSVRRAQAIKSYLVNHRGIQPARLVTLGFGEERLRDADDPRAAVNRRAEFRSLDGVTVQ